MTKQNPVPPTNVKRTPFEEENYLSSAWGRSLGPLVPIGLNCLRVLPPHADMTVINLTEAYTGGKALEGTVNRMLIKLTAGSAEECRNVSVRLSVSSCLVSTTGGITKITGKGSGDAENDSWIHPTNPKARTPVLVREDNSAVKQMTNFGYETPKGWTPVSGVCEGEEHTDYALLKAKLSAGDSAYAVVDIFRPSPGALTIEDTFEHGEDLEKLTYERSICQSDIDVSIQYEQKRIVPGTTPEQELDTVVLSLTVPLVWSPPLAASFSPSKKTTQPSGNRHPSNSIMGSSIGSESELVLIDGERVTTRCTLEAAAADNGLLVDIDEVSFLVSEICCS